jgi:two-component system nitrate/nitrite response regulator NarL
MEDLRLRPPRTTPDIVLLECLEMPSHMGRDLAALKARYPKAKLVVLCATATASRLAHAFANGASGYLLNDIGFPALLESLNLVVLGEKVFPSRMADILIEMCTTAHEPPATLAPSQQESLTTREWQILSGVVNGDSNKAIAKSLAITEATVKMHLRRARRKIQVRNRTQAAVWALKHGLPRTPNSPTLNYSGLSHEFDKYLG